MDSKVFAYCEPSSLTLNAIVHYDSRVVSNVNDNEEEDKEPPDTLHEATGPGIGRRDSETLEKTPKGDENGLDEAVVHLVGWKVVECGKDQRRHKTTEHHHNPCTRRKRFEK